MIASEFGLHIELYSVSLSWNNELMISHLGHSFSLVKGKAAGICNTPYLQAEFTLRSGCLCFLHDWLLCGKYNSRTVLIFLLSLVGWVVDV